MVIIGVFENDTRRYQTIKSQLVFFSFQQNVDFDTMWFGNNFSYDSVSKYVKDMSIAFISADSVEYRRIGKTIYQNNPACLICYYSEKAIDLTGILDTRPFIYYRWLDSIEWIGNSLEKMMTEIRNSSLYFKNISKSEFWCFPVNNIMYFQSDLKHVNMVLQNKKTKRFLSTLNALEQKMINQKIKWAFIRIHKSYLVNSDKIHFLDKKKHIAELTNGEILPISDAYYKKTVEHFENRIKKQ